MYELWLIKDGTQKVIDRQRDPQLASAHAIEQSKVRKAIVAVIREGFTDPLYYAQDGQLRSALETVRMLTVPVVEAVEPASLPVPKPRARKKPAELKARSGKPDTFKNFPVTVTAIDEETGIVEAIVNVFGIIDDGDDIIHAGAFAKTLAENGTRVRVLDSHNNRSALSVVGKPLDIREAGRDELPVSVLMQYPDATGGLYTKTQYLLNTPEGRGVFERIKAGALDEYSIGFDAIQTDNERLSDGQKARVVRNIRQVRLWEYSPVIWGMNPATATVSVKEARPTEGKPYAAFPEGDEWCVYKVDENGERMGESMGCHATEDEANDQIAALYAAEGEANSKEFTPQGAVRRLGDVLLADLMQGGTWVLTAKLGSGMISADEFSTLNTLYTTHLNEFRTMMPNDIALRELMPDMMWFAADGADDTKAGRVLNERNYQKIKQAGDLLTEVLSSAGLTDESADKRATDGPSASTEAPTPDEGAGPPDDEAPATKQAELLRILNQRLAEVEA